MVGGTAGLIRRPPSPLVWPRLRGCARPQCSYRLRRLDQQNREPKDQLEPGGQRVDGARLLQRGGLGSGSLDGLLIRLGYGALGLQIDLQAQRRLRRDRTCRPGAVQGQGLELSPSGAFRERWDHPVGLPAGTPAILGRGCASRGGWPQSVVLCGWRWCASRLTDLNRWPSLYKSAALPLS